MGGNFFLAQGDLGETLFILIFGSCGQGWAEGRLCRKSWAVREKPPPSQRGSSLGEDRALVVTLI